MQALLLARAFRSSSRTIRWLTFSTTRSPVRIATSRDRPLLADALRECSSGETRVSIRKAELALITLIRSGVVLGGTIARGCDATATRIEASGIDLASATGAGTRIAALDTAIGNTSALAAPLRHRRKTLGIALPTARRSDRGDECGGVPNSGCGLCRRERPTRPKSDFSGVRDRDNRTRKYKHVEGPATPQPMNRDPAPFRGPER